MVTATSPPLPQLDLACGALTAGMGALTSLLGLFGVLTGPKGPKVWALAAACGAQLAAGALRTRGLVMGPFGPTGGSPGGHHGGVLAAGGGWWWWVEALAGVADWAVAAAVLAAVAVAGECRVKVKIKYYNCDIMHHFFINVRETRTKSYWIWIGS